MERIFHYSTIPIFQGGQMRLGNLQLSGNLILAPMSGITDYPFRRIAKEYGCSLVFTEMVSAEGLIRKGKSFFKIGEDEHPLSVQLFGSNPEVLTKAAQMVESMGADVLDINMGCPATQVVEKGAGVALMQSPEKANEILSKVKRKIGIPLTIKIRSGWDKEHINAIEISKIAEDCGVDAICIHPRTKVQGFCGRADWSLIGEVKKTIRITLVGNGDVTTPFLAKRMFEETGCDGVMIGRGSLGNPWIFRGHPKTPSLNERWEVIKHHHSLLQDFYEERGAVKEILKHVAWYTKGLPFSASFRSTLSRIKERESLFEVIASYFDLVKRRRECHLFESMENKSVTGQEEKVF